MNRPQGTECVAGWHAVKAVLAHRDGAAQRVWLLAGRHDVRADEIKNLAKSQGVDVETVSRGELDHEAGDLPHQGVMAWVRASAPGNQNDLDILLDGLNSPPFLLVLDGVEDPRNLGACLRSADAAGVHAVIAPRDKACGLTAATRKTAAGAAETVPFFQVSNLARCLRGLRERGIWLVGLAGEAELALYDSRLSGSLALVLGAEGRGLRRLTREHCDELVRIPMSGAIESLNVSVAAAVCMFEAVRQRNT